MLEDGSPLPKFINFYPTSLNFEVVTTSDEHIGEYRIVLSTNYTEFPDSPAKTCTIPLTVEGVNGTIVVEANEEVVIEEVEEIIIP